MKLRLYNTLSREKEVFEPIHEGEVRMYNCGPTVYDYAHIGNLRAFVFVDILRRVLEWKGFSVEQVMNITDVGHLTSDADSGEDKMTKGLKREGKTLTRKNMRSLGALYTKAFKNNLKELGIKTPHRFPIASEHIHEDIELIKKLEEKGYTYTTSDGIYFDTSKDADYGKLRGGNALPSAEERARIEENPEKRRQRDFALWKFSSEDETTSGENELGWESPWGRGFPGWHIECSAMAMKYLGETLDIHTGGIDHIPTHHTNEIAQSESATGKLFAHFWLHNNHLNISGDKIAKSEGTGITLRTLVERGFHPLAFRYFVLTAHYRKELSFSWDALTSSQNALERLYTIYDEGLSRASDNGVNENYKEKFEKVLFDDLNIPQALAVTWDMLRDSALSIAEKKATLLLFDTVLGLGVNKEREIVIPPEIASLAQEREEARMSGEYEKADRLRKKIEDAGYELRDTEEGAQIHPKKK